MTIRTRKCALTGSETGAYSRSPKNPAEADLELFCNCWGAGFLGERLYKSGVGHRSARFPAYRGDT